jgi:hydrogenase maturation protease
MGAALTADGSRPAGAGAAALVFACGNPDRGDDGIAREVVARLCGRLGVTPPAGEAGDPIDLQAGVRVRICRQLLPEWAPEAAAYRRLVFLDAHVRGEPRPLVCRRLRPEDRPPMGISHVMHPEGFLRLVALLSGRWPEAFALSVRGHAFEAGSGLSPAAAALAAPAAAVLGRLLAAGGNPARRPAGRLYRV